MKDSNNYLKGRGAQYNTSNKFHKRERTKLHIESIDDFEIINPSTQFIKTSAKSLVNKVDSPDVSMFYSMNPYMGCEHGCIYCFARNTYEYWDLSAGIDFESKIFVKENAPELLRKFLMNPNWQCKPISISGNTDCYQPAERKFRLTRKLLEICNEFNQPVGIITKNAAILNDLDILKDMGSRNLVSAIITITSLDENLRRLMEPRTSTSSQRFKIIETLSNAGIKTGVMLGPMIPGLNEHDMHNIMKRASENGATFSAYTFIRLNGAIKFLFHDWLHKNFPDRAEKVWNFIEQSHDGKVNDSRWGIRMRGEGPVAEMINHQYKKYLIKYNLNDERLGLDCSKFCRPGQQLRLF